MSIPDSFSSSALRDSTVWRFISGVVFVVDELISFRLCAKVILCRVDFLFLLPLPERTLSDGDPVVSDGETRAVRASDRCPVGAGESCWS